MDQGYRYFTWREFLLDQDFVDFALKGLVCLAGGIFIFWIASTAAANQASQPGEPVPMAEWHPPGCRHQVREQITIREHEEIRVSGQVTVRIE